ncbi:hypothetical protein F5B22DRAFT_605295 [Xylaria bambusicola]|uniref:uncharacterized protein n=1 Tax=Xylaria bambusicola TaxID=326684 RepID=UPI002008E956|nr:uncharacterized protein F5B22DRAFT_605295 [Xylaria bambusicola]KAI0517203.1 hypothetical protein F5B22DRAFT_605295 [Xylaria bambusicola]
MPFITLPIYEGVGITLIVIASVLVGARCFVNYHASNGKLNTHDYMSIVGWSFLVTTYAVNDIVVRAVSVPVQNLDLPLLFRLAIVIIILVQGTLWFTKAPILFLYVKLFGIHRWLLYISWATLLVTGLVYVAGLIFTLVSCATDDLTLIAYQQCAHDNTLTGVISGFVSVIADAVIFILPIPVIFSLQLETSKKIGLSVTFLSGILGIAASVVALYYKYVALFGDGTQLIAPIFFFTIEAFVAMAVGCAPAIRSFWIRYISKTNLDSSTASESAYSHVLSRTSRKPPRNPTVTDWERSDEHINRNSYRSSPSGHLGHSPIQDV